MRSRRGAGESGRRAPGPLLLLGGAAIALAFVVDHPLILAALAVGGLLLGRAAPRPPGRLYVIGGLVSGLGLALINPLVVSDGNTIIFSGPESSVLDLEVTAEEIAAGLSAGLRVFAVALLLGAVLAHVDPDRLLARAARLTPRSAMTLALAARLLPALERDARAIGETARLRGLDLSEGSRLGRARRAAPLMLPLLGSGLERGLDIAEAMAARGYGSGRRTHLAERRLDAAERTTLALAAGLAALALAAALLGLGGYRFYPTLGPIAEPADIAVALAVLGILGGAALALRRGRRDTADRDPPDGGCP